MTTQTITIPAREVRPGDVLFGMTVQAASPAVSQGDMCFVFCGESPGPVWTGTGMQVTVERPVLSDPIGTVRAYFGKAGHPLFAVVKVNEIEWQKSGDDLLMPDSAVTDFPILWKPGMPIPTEEG